MLSESEIKKLETHIVAIFQNLVLPEITPEGYILARSSDGIVYSDNVTTHHLVELCLEIGEELTQDLIEKSCNWFIAERNNLQDPFTITTLALARRINPEEAKLIVTKVLEPSQRSSGFIDLYAGFLDGGSVFSTLWAIKILLLLSNHVDNKFVLEKAFGAIANHWDDIHRSSFKGYFCELGATASKLGLLDIDIEEAVNEIVSAQSESGSWDNRNLYTAYILGNLINVHGLKGIDVSQTIDKGIRYLFNLEDEANRIPKELERPGGIGYDSPYIQLVIRSLICAIRYLRQFNGSEVSSAIASTLLGTYPLVYTVAKQLDAQLKKMDEQYGKIQDSFSHLDEKAKSLLSVSPYEKNVFIMMPFRQNTDERYESIEKIIRDELKKEGYKAWLATDKKLAPQLWDNVATYLIACKYSIAVFTRVEKGTEISVEEFNPNVSLELGFFLARGKDILILKDQLLPKLPTDIVGHLYKEFDLNNVRRQLPKIIKAWIKEISQTT